LRPQSRLFGKQLPNSILNHTGLLQYRKRSSHRGPKGRVQPREFAQAGSEARIHRAVQPRGFSARVQSREFAPCGSEARIQCAGPVAGVSAAREFSCGNLPHRGAPLPPPKLPPSPRPRLRVFEIQTPVY
jgi:hypothetical protein